MGLVAKWCLTTTLKCRHCKINDKVLTCGELSQLEELLQHVCFLNVRKKTDFAVAVFKDPLGLRHLSENKQLEPMVLACSLLSCPKEEQLRGHKQFAESQTVSKKLNVKQEDKRQEA